MKYIQNLVFDNTFFRFGLITLLVVVILETFADVFNWYYIFPKLDTPMHVLGGMIIGFFALAYTSRGMNSIQKLLWVILWTLIIGIALELVEWWLDTHAHLGILLQKTTLDTYTDILHDFVGGSVAFCIGYFTRRI